MKLLAVCLLFVLTTQVFAASCYTADQFRAEQAIRYHTTLMITGMRCQKILSPTAYGDYTAFSARNGSVIRKEEYDMMGYFRKNGGGNAERALHTFRTDLANNMSMQANGPNVVAFCRAHAGDLAKAKTMQPTDFKSWVKNVDVKTPETAHPLCTATKTSKKKSKT